MEGWLEFEITLEDLRRAARFQFASRTRAPRLTRALIVLSAAVVVLLGLLTVVDGGFDWAREPVLQVLFSLIVLVALLGVLVYLGTPRVVAWQAARQRDVLGPRRLRIGDDGVHAVSQNMTGVVAWSGIERLAEHEGTVYLCLDKDQMIVVPARAFGAAGSGAFVEACRRYLAAK